MTNLVANAVDARGGCHRETVRIDSGQRGAVVASLIAILPGQTASPTGARLWCNASIRATLVAKPYATACYHSFGPHPLRAGQRDHPGVIPGPPTGAGQRAEVWRIATNSSVKCGEEALRVLSVRLFRSGVDAWYSSRPMEDRHTIRRFPRAGTGAVYSVTRTRSSGRRRVGRTDGGIDLALNARSR